MFVGIKVCPPTNQLGSCSSFTQMLLVRLIKADNELYALNQPMEVNEDIYESVKESETVKHVSLCQTFSTRTFKLIIFSFLCS